MRLFVSVAIVFLFSVQSAKSQEPGPVSAFFDDQSRTYHVSVAVTDGFGREGRFVLLGDTDVEPGEEPDSVDFQWIVADDALSRSNFTLEVDGDQLRATITGRDSGYLTFRLAAEAFERLANSNSIIFSSSGLTWSLNQEARHDLRAFHHALSDPAELARLAHGPEATEDDLRGDLSPRQQVEDFSAYRLSYDRFDREYSVVMLPQPVEVLSGADSVSLMMVITNREGQIQDPIVLAFGILSPRTDALQKLRG